MTSCEAKVKFVETRGRGGGRRKYDHKMKPLTFDLITQQPSQNRTRGKTHEDVEDTVGYAHDDFS
jgi:hypothetical protein